jgi:hypothetical protein
VLIIDRECQNETIHQGSLSLQFSAYKMPYQGLSVAKPLIDCYTNQTEMFELAHLGSTQETNKASKQQKMNLSYRFCGRELWLG